MGGTRSNQQTPPSRVHPRSDHGEPRLQRIRTRLVQQHPALDIQCGGMLLKLEQEARLAGSRQRAEPHDGCLGRLQPLDETGKTTRKDAALSLDRRRPKSWLGADADAFARRCPRQAPGHIDSETAVAGRQRKAPYTRADTSMASTAAIPVTRKYPKDPSIATTAPTAHARSAGISTVLIELSAAPAYAAG